MKIYESFNEIADNFDTLLVDAYGVFWGGASTVPGSLETMEKEVKKGKRVCILSNTTLIGDTNVLNYSKKGLTKGIHYTDIITSGDVCYHYLCHDKLPFKGHKVYIIGQSRFAISEGTPFEVVEKPENADILFMGSPQLTAEQTEKFPHLKNQFFAVDEKCQKFDTATVEPFLNELEYLKNLELPAIGTNPDLIVLEKHFNRPGADWVIRQGSLAQAYRQMGGEVLEFGKPYQNIYDYAFQKFGIKPSKKIAMIGDTFRTDIQGALNCGISPVWCLDYGVAKYETEHGKTLEQQAGGSLEGIHFIHHL